MKKIIVAPDSFKGSLTSAEVADAVERGIKDVFPQCNVVKAGVADGGEGTVEAIVKRWEEICTQPPLQTPWADR